MINYLWQPEPDFAGLRDLYAANGWTTYLRDWPRTQRAIAASHTCIAETNHRAVGLIRGISDGESILYIQDLLVAPDYQRQGIGQRLLAELSGRFPVAQTVLIAEPTAQAARFYAAAGLLPITADYGQAYVLDRRFDSPEVTA